MTWYIMKNDIILEEGDLDSILKSYKTYSDKVIISTDNLPHDIF